MDDFTTVYEQILPLFNIFLSTQIVLHHKVYYFFLRVYDFCNILYKLA